jgi:uncharacterized protein (DUF924 family)
MITPDDVLSFWFGELRDDGSAADEIAARWWKKDAGFDALIAERFGAVLEQASTGALDAWCSTDAGRVALVVVLDQFSRNVHRDTPRAFAQDDRAHALVEAAWAEGVFDRVPPMHAYFLAMPFMHAERADAQARCVAIFERLRDRAPGEALRATFEGGVDFARRHEAIVVRFGRFPHRNAILGRASTAEELGFLEQPGSSF